jgi:hypothetical protein
VQIKYVIVANPLLKLLSEQHYILRLANELMKRFRFAFSLLRLQFSAMATFSFAGNHLLLWEAINLTERLLFRNHSIDYN